MSIEFKNLHEMKIGPEPGLERVRRLAIDALPGLLGRGVKVERAECGEVRLVFKIDVTGSFVLDESICDEHALILIERMGRSYLKELRKLHDVLALELSTGQPILQGRKKGNDDAH